MATGALKSLGPLLCALGLSGAGAAGAAAQPLTDRPGDPERGLAAIRDASRASCLICHRISALPDRDQGEIAPSLDGVGLRYTPDELRQRIVDARRVAPDTIMPPYYSTEGLYRVGAKWAGRTIYDAQDVEDVLAFLTTLQD